MVTGVGYPPGIAYQAEEKKQSILNVVHNQLYIPRKTPILLCHRRLYFLEQQEIRLY